MPSYEWNGKRLNHLRRTGEEGPGELGSILPYDL